MTRLGVAIAELISRSGSIGFDEYMAHALYAPEAGFYQVGGGAGRRRDFLTSAEVGPLFGAVLAGALDRWWDQADRPDRFHLIEAGAGPGTLARSILAARPRCTPALSVTLVEVGRAQWESHPPEATSRADLPSADEVRDDTVVVLANELLDNLPCALAERTGDGWCEVRVGLDGSGALTEVLEPLPPDRSAWCTRLSQDPPVGARIPIQHHAVSWLTAALDLAGLGPAGPSGAGPGAGGRVVVFDYTDSTPSMARRPWTEWLRTYARHGRAGHPLEAPGQADITVEVATDQLAAVRRADRTRTQAEFLADHGLSELVEQGRARWQELGIAGGIEALAARSRISESEALTDPAGLGGFTVLEWDGTSAGASS